MDSASARMVYVKRSPPHTVRELDCPFLAGVFVKGGRADA
jgi:hypothetical protein